MLVKRIMWKLLPIKRFLIDDLAVYLRMKNKKSPALQVRDCYVLYRKFTYIPYHYFKTPLCTLYSSSDVTKYIPPKLIEKALPDLNFLRTHEEGRRLADKATFEKIMAGHSLPCIRTIAIVDEKGRLTTGSDGEPLDETRLRAALAPFGGKAFIKPLKGAGGAGARAIDLDRDGLAILRAVRSYIVQPLLSQHPDMAALFPGCINTVRIDSFLEGSRCLHNAAVVRIGTGQSLADNWDLGAIAVGVDLDTGRLMRAGWKKNKFGQHGGFISHPDSGIEFDGYQIPFWAEIKRLVCAAADIARPCRSLGWDVAVTPDGPVLVETNVLWDVNLMQTAWGGLADRPLARHVIGCPEAEAGMVSPDRGAQGQPADKETNAASG